MGTWKRNLAAIRISAHLDVAHDDVGNDLADQHLGGRAGMESRFSMVPLSCSRVMASAVMTTMVMVRTTPGARARCCIRVMASGL